MEVGDEHVAALRAMLRNELEAYKRLYSVAIEKSFGMLLAAAFVQAVERRFGERRSVNDIIRYVAAARARQGNAADQIDPLAAERLIRAALGETSAVAGMDEDLHAGTQVAVLDELVTDEHFDDAGLEEFLARSRARAERIPG